jgi:hypothetical protein
MDRIKALRQFVADNNITFSDQHDPNAMSVTLTGEELKFLAVLLRATQLDSGELPRKISEALSEYEEFQVLYNRAL